MFALADDDALLLLEFETERNIFDQQVARIRKANSPGGTTTSLHPDSNSILNRLTVELERYFAGKLQKFDTPIRLTGSDFQCSVWKALLSIAFGETRSYAQIAAQIGNPNAVRAAANANGKNALTLLVPCHRVIRSGGALGGYGGGLDRKKWLLELEAKAVKPDQTQAA